MTLRLRFCTSMALRSPQVRGHVLSEIFEGSDTKAAQK